MRTTTLSRTLASAPAIRPSAAIGVASARAAQLHDPERLGAWRYYLEEQVFLGDRPFPSVHHVD